jgi:hypothetical protein
MTVWYGLRPFAVLLVQALLGPHLDGLMDTVRCCLSALARQRSWVQGMKTAAGRAVLHNYRE